MLFLLGGGSVGIAESRSQCQNPSGPQERPIHQTSPSPQTLRRWTLWSEQLRTRQWKSESVETEVRTTVGHVKGPRNWDNCRRSNDKWRGEGWRMTCGGSISGSVDITARAAADLSILSVLGWNWFLGTSVSCTLLPARTHLAADNWFVCFCIVRSFEREDSLENVQSVLICLIEKRSF